MFRTEHFFSADVHLRDRAPKLTRRPGHGQSTGCDRWPTHIPGPWHRANPWHRRRLARAFRSVSFQSHYVLVYVQS